MTLESTEPAVEITQQNGLYILTMSTGIGSSDGIVKFTIWAPRRVVSGQRSSGVSNVHPDPISRYGCLARHRPNRAAAHGHKIFRT